MNWGTRLTWLVLRSLVSVECVREEPGPNQSPGPSWLIFFRPDSACGSEEQVVVDGTPNLPKRVKGEIIKAKTAKHRVEMNTRTYGRSKTTRGSFRLVVEYFGAG